MQDFPIPLPFTLKITKGDIQRGKKCTTRMCPVALALERRIPGRVYIEVDPPTITLKTSPETGWTIQLEKKVVHWIEAFDEYHSKPEDAAPISTKITAFDIIAQNRKELSCPASQTSIK